MKQVLAFDVYGTLIDTHGLRDQVSAVGIKKVEPFLDAWRNKQLEFSFRRAAMGDYAPFSVCTKEALSWVIEKQNLAIDQKQISTLLESYQSLPAFDDCRTLNELSKNRRMVAFSNGEEKVVRRILEQAGIIQYFETVISADDVQVLKPAPAIYQHLLKAVMCPPQQVSLISSNPFDICGAQHCGLPGIWLNRTSQPYDGWHVPHRIIHSLGDLINKS